MLLLFSFLLLVSQPAGIEEILGEAGELIQIADSASQARLRELAAGLSEETEPNSKALEQILISWAEFLAGNDAAAELAETQSRQLLDELPADDYFAANARYLIGVFHRQRSEYARAASWWEQAAAGLEAMRGEARDPASICWILSDLAEMKRLLGEPALAESIQTRSVGLARDELPEDGFTATLINNLAALQWDRGGFDQAEINYREALRISLADSTAAPSRLAIAHLNLGVLLRDQFKFDLASEHLERAAVLSADAFAPNDPALDMFQLELGKLYEATDRPGEAIERWQRALEQLRARPQPHPIYEARILDDMGRAFLARGVATQAESHFERALRLRERTHDPSHPDIAVSRIGWLQARLAQGNVGGAERELDAAIAVLQNRSTAPEVLAQGLGLRAALHLRRDELDSAWTDIQQALDVLEELRQLRGASSITRASFLEQHLELYALASDVALARGDAEAALGSVEAARARVFHERLSRSHSADAQQESSRERALAAELATTQRELWRLQATLEARADLSPLTELEERRARLLQEIRDEQDLLRLAEPSREDLPPLRMAEIHGELLDEDTALLVYEIGRERCRVYVLADDQLEVHELEVAPELAELLHVPVGSLTANALQQLIGTDQGALDAIERSRGVVGARPVDPGARVFTQHSLGHALWQILMPEALWSRLRERRECVVVPDGALHRFPFEALVIDEVGPRYWLDDGPTVRYAGSLRSLLAQTQRSAEPVVSELMLFSVADPVFAEAREAWQLPALPGTRLESELVQSAFAEWPCAVHLGADATERAIKRESPRARYVHLATHGLVDEGRSELLAALALSAPAVPSPEDDGFLYLQELSALQWNCELAVLSACSTQRGRELGGEGVFALARAAQAAGARRAVASLWAVDDRSTSELIGGFFEQVAAAESAGRRPDYARALRDAKRRIRAQADHASPYYWAAFVLSGPR